MRWRVSVAAHSPCAHLSGSVRNPMNTPVHECGNVAQCSGAQASAAPKTASSPSQKVLPGEAMRTHPARWVTLRSIFGFTALLAMAGAHAQTGVTIRAANSVNKQILGVTFAPNSATVLNTDQATLGKLNALALVTNPNSFGIDLFAADNQNHHIWSYAGDFCPASPPPPAPPVTPACTTTGSVFQQAALINYPDGLSVDAGGSLFAVDNAPGKSPLPQVWVMQLLN